MAIIVCPNCGNKFKSRRHKNRWVEWFEGLCERCGWHFKLKDTEYDFIQPSHPLYNEIYNNNPIEIEKANKRAMERKRGNELDDMLTKWKIKNKSYEYDYMKKYVEEREEK